MFIVWVHADFSYGLGCIKKSVLQNLATQSTWKESCVGATFSRQNTCQNLCNIYVHVIEPLQNMPCNSYDGSLTRSCAKTFR